MRLTLGDAVSFLARVRQGQPDDCWPFDGPPRVEVRGRRLTPAWLAAAIARGRLLNADEVVRQRCATEGCANPAHLRVLHRSDVPFTDVRQVASRVPDCATEATCSFCGTKGGAGTAVVCGAPCPCSSCTTAEWPALVAKYGAASA